MLLIQLINLLICLWYILAKFSVVKYNKKQHKELSTLFIKKKKKKKGYLDIWVWFAFCFFKSKKARIRPLGTLEKKEVQTHQWS